MTATDLFAALVVEKFLVAMAETGLAKRENILAAMVANVTKRSMRTVRLSAVRTPENARDDQVICCWWFDGGAAAANGDSVSVSCGEDYQKSMNQVSNYYNVCKI